MEERVLYSAAPLDIPTENDEAVVVHEVTDSSEEAAHSSGQDSPTSGDGATTIDVTADEPAVNVSESNEAGLAHVVATTVQKWEVIGLPDGHLESLTDVVYDVMAEDGEFNVEIESEAGGIGWYIDQTAVVDHEYYLTIASDSAFFTNIDSEVQPRVDLISILMSDTGRVLGLDEAMMSSAFMADSGETLLFIDSQIGDGESEEVTEVQTVPGAVQSRNANSSGDPSANLGASPQVTIPNFPEPVTINERVTNTIVSTTLPGISVSDSDTSTLTVTISITGGELSVGATETGGLTAGSITGQNTNLLTLNGSVAAINATLDGGLQIRQIDSDFNDNIVGSISTLLITASDGENQGSDSILVSFAATNDPPEISSPGTQTVIEDTNLVFSSANGNQISVSDPDAGESSDVVRVTLATNSGLLTLSTTAGLDFATDGNVGDGTLDGIVTFRGTIGAVNTALAGLVYRGVPNFNSTGSNPADLLTITVNDLGNTGQDPSNISGQPNTGDSTSEQATSFVSINVTAVNDAPVNSVPTTQATNTDTTIELSAANGNAIQVSDVDVDETASPNNLLQVSLLADNGAVITLTSTTGIDFGFNDALGTGDNDGADGMLVLRGTTTAINNALNSLTVTPDGGFSGNIELTVTTSDLGNTGLGNAVEPASNFDIFINYTDNSITASQQLIFDQAVERWERVIIDNGLNLAVDLTIDASNEDIDGVGGVLGSAGPRSFHSGTNFSRTGIMRFDTADVAALEASGELLNVILHEMGHILGIGTAWDRAGLINAAETEYSGANALAAYNFAFGINVAFIPVEDDGGPGTAGGHWEENEGANPLTSELMTGYLSGGAELSIITIGSLQDIGYQINYLGADTYRGTNGADYLSSLGGGALTDTDSFFITVADIEPPVLESFERAVPSSTISTNADSVVFRATFNEEVKNVGIGDFAVSGSSTASVSNVVRINGTTYDIIVPGGNLANYNGAVGVNISGSHDIADLSDNALPVAEPAIDETFTIDNLRPTPTLSTIANPTGNDLFPVTIDFGESVTTFTTADIIVTNGAVQGSITDNGNGVYTATINSTSDGIVSITIRNNGAQDLAGNNSIQSATLSVDVDTTAPTATINVSPDPRNTSVGPVSIVFNETVVGVDISDFTLTRNGAAVDISGLTLSGSGANYSIDLSSVTSAVGNYTLTLNASGSGITDDFGYNMTSNAVDSWVKENTPPTADIIDVSPDPREVSVGNVNILFSEAVSGVDISDFTLTRDGNAVDISSLAVSGSGASYSVNLNSVTSPDGTYILTLNATSSGILDTAGNALIVDATDQWRVDDTDPTADIVDVTPNQRNTPVGTVEIVFNESVTGLDISDFSLTRDGSSVDISGLSVSGSGANYSIDLSSVSGDAGTFVLTLTALNSGVQDATGNALTANATDSWFLDEIRPTVDITNVTPDPRNIAVGNVNIVFSEAVTDVDITDFRLTRNGSVVDISGLSVAGSNSNYSIDFTSVTDVDGDYVLTLTAATSGIIDLVGNTLDGDVIDAWRISTRNPTANIIDVTPDPRTNSVGTVNIQFDEIVSGVNIADFSLTRNGVAVDISSLSVTGVGKNYAIDLSSVTGDDGDYVLTLVAADSGIKSIPKNALVENAEDSWVKDSTPPTVDITDVSPDPRNANAGIVDIVFDEPVTGVDIGDFSLTRNGSAVNTSSLGVAGSGADYSIDLSTVTAIDGTYVLTLNSSGAEIQDIAGNVLVGGASDSWTTDFTAPTADIVDVTPDPRTTNTGTVNITFSESVNGVDISDFTLTRNGIGIDLSSLTVSGSGSSYAIDLSSVTAADGNYALSFTAAGSGVTDSVGNLVVSDSTDHWIVDLTAPTADISDVTPDPRNRHAGQVNVIFSETVNGVDISNFSLTRNGTVVDISGLSVNGGGSNYSIDLTSVTNPLGDYVLTLNASGSGIQDTIGNAFVSDANDLWTRIPNSAPTIGAVADQTISHNQDTLVIPLTIADADGDMVTLEAEVFQLDAIAQVVFDLDQEHNFTALPGGEFLNNRGVNEKYFSISTGFGFILESGEIYRFGGSIAASTLLGNADASYYADLSRLYNASAPSEVQLPAVQSSFSGNELSIDPPAGFTGSFTVRVTANDGVQATTREFGVTVTN